MPYRIYNTDAVVIDIEDVGEASRRISLLTRDLGLIHAHAQGIRLLKSKLRFHLQLYRSVSVSLLMGREMWRIIGAMDSKPVACPFFPRIARMLLRLITGEEAAPKLFDIIRSPLVETEMTARLLGQLGYLDVESLPHDELMLAKELRRALAASHL